MNLNVTAQVSGDRLNFMVGGKLLEGTKSFKGNEGIRKLDMKPTGVWHAICKAWGAVVDVKINGQTYVVGKRSYEEFLGRNKVHAENVTNETAQLFMDMFLKNASMGLFHGRITKEDVAAAGQRERAPSVKKERSQSVGGAAAAPSKLVDPKAVVVFAARQLPGISVPAVVAAAAQAGLRQVAQLPDGGLSGPLEDLTRALALVPANDRADEGVRRVVLAAIQQGAPVGQAVAQAVEQPAPAAAAAQPAPAAHAAPAAAAAAPKVSVDQDQANHLVRNYLDKRLGGDAGTKAQNAVLKIIDESQDKGEAKKMITAAFEGAMQDARWLNNRMDPNQIRKNILQPLLDSRR